MLNFLKKNYLIISILLIAAFFRLFNIYGYAEFLGDQGRDLIIIRDFLVNHNLFFIGPQTSIGNMYLGPYFYYLIAPSLWLSNFDPIGPAIFIALIGIATVYLVFYLVKKIFDHLSAAYLAAFFYAISPVVIKYSTFSWNPNIMPFFTLLFVLFIYRLSLKKNISI
jgi:4-amino-4-deoxy-L-arabinose transferase-like glycosyltransferase